MSPFARRLGAQACSLMFDVFEFRTEGGAVTVTAQTHLSDASDAQYSVVGSGMCKEMLQARARTGPPFVLVEFTYKCLGNLLLGMLLSSMIGRGKAPTQEGPQGVFGC